MLFGQSATGQSIGAPPGSTYNEEPAGLSAIYAALAGNHTRRFELPPARLPANIDTLVIWAPADISPAEWQQIRSWVGLGHKAVIAGNLPANIKRTSDMNLAWANGSPVLASWPEGQGRIYWFDNTEWLTNLRIGNGENFNLAMSLLTPTKGKDLAFDEYHHGYQAAERWWQVLRGPLQIFVIQMAVALALLFWAYGTRFGAPRPLPAGPPRAAVEYVHSMGQLYHRANARSVVLAQMHRSLRQELSRMLGGIGGLQNDEIARRTANQTSLPADQIEAMLNRTAPDLKPEPTETELIALVRAVEDLQRRMRNAGYRDQHDA